MKSKNILYLIYFLYLLIAFFYYPKWNKGGSEATISWDTSGYYWYLPALFIYDDLEKLSFSQKILDKYQSTPYFGQAFDHWSGNKIMKYSSGMAVQYLAFFMVAHVLAEPLGYEADGFSAPYQFAIMFGSIIMFLIGLWFFRKILLHFFDEFITSLVLIAICFGTNYLDYATIDNAMTHNWLFTWYCILIYNTIHFYNKTNWKNAIMIGICVGICGLTRPTDLLSAFIPICWNMFMPNLKTIASKWDFVKQNIKYFLGAGFIAGCIGFLQIAYFRLVGKEWFIYTYQDQKFSWFKPHVMDYLFSFSTGWLIYTPLFFLLLVGIVIMIKKRNVNSIALIGFALLNTYVVTAWDYWMYGGRAMVQSYPVLGIILGFAFQAMTDNRWIKYFLYTFIGFCIYYNLWWTHGVHKGGYYDAYNATKAYFYHTVCRLSIDEEAPKLYDAKEIYTGKRKNIKVVHSENYDTDTTLTRLQYKMTTICDGVTKDRQYSNVIKINTDHLDGNWLRVNAFTWAHSKEWDIWKSPQFTVQFKNGNEVVKRSFFKPNRFLNDGEQKMQHLDVKIPKEKFNSIEFYVWNANSERSFLFDDVVVETYDEE